MEPNQNNFRCYITGAVIGCIISLILANVLTDGTKISGSAFLDVHAGSLLTIFVYTFIIGDAQKLIKQADSYSILIFPIIMIAGIAPIVNWILPMPILFLLAPFLEPLISLELTGLYFIYGGSNMLGFYFIYKN